MKRIVLWLVGLSLLAALLAGCGSGTEASQGQEAADAAVGGQAAENAPASPEIVDPAEVNAQSQAAGETPSILGSTPEAGQVGTWERDTFFDTWEIGYPDGWEADKSGDIVVLSGRYGSEQYRVELTQPASVEGDDAEIWAKADLAALGQPDAPLTKVSVTGVDAWKASNVRLPGATENACASARVYGQEGDPTGALHRIIITVTQTTGNACSEPNTERLADALIAETRLQ